MYEPRHHPPLSPAAFGRRLLSHLAFVLLLLGGSLLLGMAGYHWLEGLGWLDSFTNAAMLLSGMGPLHAPHSDAGKLFAGCYALYSGLVFIAIATLLVAPVLHRVLHRFHFDAQERHETPPPAD